MVHLRIGSFLNKLLSPSRGAVGLFSINYFRTKKKDSASDVWRFPPACSTCNIGLPCNLWRVATTREASKCSEPASCRSSAQFTPSDSYANLLFATTTTVPSSTAEGYLVKRARMRTACAQYLVRPTSKQPYPQSSRSVCCSRRICTQSHSCSRHTHPCIFRGPSALPCGRTSPSTPAPSGT